MTPDSGSAITITGAQVNTWLASGDAYRVTDGTLDPVWGLQTVTFTIPPGGSTFTWAAGAIYNISVEEDFFKPTAGAGSFNEITASNWRVGTAALWGGYAESCHDAEFALNIDPLSWDPDAFCGAVQREIYGLPCAKIFQTKRRAYGDNSTTFQFRFIDMAPGTCSVALDLLETAYSTGSLAVDLEGLRRAAGYSDPRNVNSPIIHTGTFTILDGTSDEFLPIAYKVFNTPDRAGNKTEVTIHLTPSTAALAFHAGGYVVVTMPYDWIIDVETALIQISEDATTWYTCTGQTISGTSLTAKCLGTPNMATAQIKIYNMTMPDTCLSLNTWMWATKTYDSNFILTNHILKNPEQDSCQGITAILFGDPHFESFAGGTYDVNGRAGFPYNIITDERFVWNSNFVSLNTKGRGSMHTFMGESAFLINDQRILCDPVSWKMFVGGLPVPMDDKRHYLASNEPWYVKLTKSVMYIRAPGFFIGLKGIAKEHGKPLPHFDHVVTLTDEPNGRTNPHGLLGQTVHHKSPAHPKGHQGEGVIEGFFDEYELESLWSRKFRFSRYRL
eukprot:NODE_592_length_1782_cov_57.687613_g582_i0.p1 GENE.NODE_592_length_1782_cov_57.687613_g582_i0~~NODE_592_length_1782_cov_57.687613_g582_i0.p1  ORF type:complete len:588 (+),score=152.36 NODE_592_length_1782_cov_57.687613_g582_i0:92-1765(+)